MHYLIDLNELPDNSSRGFEIEGHSLFVIRVQGVLRAYANACPHLGITLEYRPHQFLDESRRYIQCANHDARFTPETGLCVAGPCLGQTLKSLPLQLINNKLYLSTLADAKE